MSKVMTSGNERIKSHQRTGPGRRKSQIAEYLNTTVQGVQHIAMATDDILKTVGLPVPGASICVCPAYYDEPVPIGKTTSRSTN